jgi:hypothetical protein
MNPKFKSVFLLSILLLFLNFTTVLNKSLFSKFQQRKEQIQRIDYSFVERLVLDPMFSASCKSSMGVTGRCLREKFEPVKYGLEAGAAEVANSYFSGISKMMSFSTDMCVGDYKASNFEYINGLKNAGCDNLPLVGDETFGVISFNTFLPCSLSAPVAACFVFSGCHTVAISVSGGLLSCVSSVSSAGVASFLAPFIELIDYLNAGFSINRKLSHEVKYLSLNSNGYFELKTKSLKGHVSLGFGLTFPLDFKIGSYSLKDLLEFKVQASFLLDLGKGVSSVSIQRFIKSIFKRETKAKRSEVEEIFKITPEFSATMKGKLSIKLQQLTGGFLEDFEMDIGDCNLIVTSAGKYTESELPNGVYIYFETNLFLGFMKNLLDGLFKHFENILKIFGIGKPSLSNRSSLFSNKVGIVMNSELVGFQLNFYGFEIDCFWRFKDNKGSCKFDHIIFVAIREGVNYIVKEAAKFFDETGKTVGKFTANFVNMIVSIGAAVNSIAKIADPLKDLLASLDNLAKVFGKKS